MRVWWGGEGGRGGGEGRKERERREGKKKREKEGEEIREGGLDGGREEGEKRSLGRWKLVDAGYGNKRPGEAGVNAAADTAGKRTGG